MKMFKRKYQVEEISPTRIFVRNKSFWRNVGIDNIAKIIEGLNSSGRIVTATIPSRSTWNAFDYLIITLPKK